MKAIPDTPAAQVLRRIALALLLGAMASLGGCAAGPNPRDPLEPFNRRVMEFNEGVDSIALKPAATFYREKVPALVRTGVSNFFGNLRDGWSFVNSLLQLKLQDAQENFARVHINTFIGLGGIFDVASDLNIERHKEDFGQTLGRWGMPPGPFIMLPLLGPSTLRDTLAWPVDSQGDLLSKVDPWGARDALYILRIVDVRSNLLRASSVLDEAALDKYSFIRDAHLQRRRAEIFESTPSDDAALDSGTNGHLPPLPADEPTPGTLGTPQPSASPVR